MLMIGDWCIDQSEGIASKQDSNNTIVLKSEMVRVLECLAENQHRLVTSKELFDNCWSNESDSDKCQVQTVEKTIEGLCEAFGIKLIDVYDEQHYLLNLPIYRYTFQPVSLDDVRAEALKELERKRCVKVRSKSCREPEPQLKSNNIIVKILAAAAIIAIAAFVAQQ